MAVFYPTEILLPYGDKSKWSVVACDQFTAEPSYWEEAERLVNSAPSALRLILPEAWLGTERELGAQEKIAETMQRYIREGAFEEHGEAFLYLERTQRDGRVRRGLMAALDLEEYDYRPGTEAAVRATEGTVEERLPARIRIREKALLEMPHVMVLADDPSDSIMYAASLSRGEAVYDFPLMLGGGHLRGWIISAEKQTAVKTALDALQKEKELAFAVGDGNHSLAAAKRYWESLCLTLSETERETHPARFALVEITNIHDPALDFEPIHRVIFDTDDEAFSLEFEDNRDRWENPSRSLGERVAAAESFCRTYIEKHGGRLDYIHGDDTARRLGAQKGCCAVLLPPIDKAGLFRSVAEHGALPRKSFSMGHAEDKRYYLECRIIRR